MKILLVYPPFCTPVSPPYSLTNLRSFLINNSKHDIKILDLNQEFHTLKFPKYKQYFQNNQWQDYANQVKQYNNESRETYAKNNKLILNNENPEYIEELLNLIENEKPDLIAFSIVYSSQAFYTTALIKQLKIPTVIGGPSVTEKLKQLTTHFNNEVEFLEHINKEKVIHKNLNTKYPVDFSMYKGYFTPQLVIPLKTSTTCFYKQCTFCAHYAKVPYMEYPIGYIEQTISNHKYFFLIDDMIPIKRLLTLSAMFAKHNIKWGCQLRPTKEHTKDVMDKLYQSGLSFVLWGVESGNQRVLDLIKKGTQIGDVKIVLENSHNAGIKNVTYIMFGFPTETEEEFMDTINFLKTNKENIDLISTSTFGLHKDTPIYNNPENFGVSEIKEEARTLLNSKITYQAQGLSKEQLKKLIKANKMVIQEVNKFPKEMNFFREHMFFSQ